MAELFGVTVPNIVYHLQQIEASGEIHLSDGYKKYLYVSDKWSLGRVGEYCLHRATHHAKGTCNGGEYGDQDFEDFFPVDSHGV